MNNLPSSKKSNIIFFCTAVLNPGGLERLFLEEEKYFAKKNVRTTILTFYLSKDAMYNYSPQNIEILDPNKSKILRVLSLRSKIKEISPDLIIGQTYADGMYLFLATLFTSIRYAIHIHGTFFWFPEDKIKYSIMHKSIFHEIRDSVFGHKEFIPIRIKMSLVERLKVEILAVFNYLAVRRAAMVFTLNDHMSWEVERIYNVKSIIPQGCLSTEQINFIPKRNIKKELSLGNKKIILSISRLDIRKRVDLLIKSFAILNEKYDDIFLVIGGTGEYSKKLIEIANNLDIRSSILFLGFVPENDLFEYYSSCDIFAFPSWCAHGLTPYEALACGKKVVWSTDAINQPKLINNEYIFSADPTPESYAVGIEKALNSNPVSPLVLEDYTWDKYFDTIRSSINS